MTFSNVQIAWQYRTLLIIWIAALVSQPLFYLFVYMTVPIAVLFDLSAPFIGDHYYLIPIMIILGLEGLISAYFRHSSVLKRSVIEQNPKFVQDALVFAVSGCISTTLWGVFLAFFYEYRYFYLWFLAGTLGLVFYFPKRSQLEMASFSTSA